MPECLNCSKPFKRIRGNQRFCCPKCKDAFHNREKMQGIRLIEKNRIAIQSLADAHDVSLHEMVNIILNQSIDTSGQPLTDDDIYGKPNSV